MPPRLPTPTTITSPDPPRTLQEELTHAEQIYTLYGPPRSPARPYTLTSAILPPSQPPLCHWPLCPFRFPHPQGLFQTHGAPSPHETTAPEHYDFGLSNPPPEIWDARERLMSARERDGDRGLVCGFIHYHFVPRTEVEEGYPPSTTTSEDPETQMLDLAEGIGAVALEAGDPPGEEGTSAVGVYAGVPDDDDDDDGTSQDPVSERGGPTEAEIEAEIARDLEDAFDDMEVEEVAERAAGMVIDDDDDDDGGTERSQVVGEGVLRVTETEFADCNGIAGWGSWGVI
ncbi:MAG: hypothetical protein Q9182_003542 [Xanthomendoza sp. 2 TL-2023]